MFIYGELYSDLTATTQNTHHIHYDIDDQINFTAAMMVSQFFLIVPIWYYMLYNIKVYEILMQPAIKIISWLKKKQQNETIIIFINTLIIIIIIFQRSAQTRLKITYIMIF